MQIAPTSRPIEIAVLWFFACWYIKARKHCQIDDSIEPETCFPQVDLRGLADSSQYRLDSEFTNCYIVLYPLAIAV